MGVIQSENPLPSWRKNPRSPPEESVQMPKIRPQTAPATNSTDAGKAANAKAAQERDESIGG